MAFMQRPLPIIAAPMAGASTPELAAAVTRAGGLGFLAAGYLTTEAMAAEVAAYRALTDGPVAVNLFTPQLDRSAELAPRIKAYRASLQPVAAALDTRLGEPVHDDDDFTAKVAWLADNRVEAVTFTFGPAPARAVAALRAAGTSVGFTVSAAHEARQAAGLGADFLVAQGAGAGGHRGTWNVSDQPNDLDTTQVTRAALSGAGLPVIAAGGVAGPGDVRHLLDAGAVAVAVGTLFLACEESKASPSHKAALVSGEFTEARTTRAFSGRCARALVNDFVRDHDATAPAAYPNLHHLTKPLRTAAAAAGDVHRLALWAGSGHLQARERTAATVVDLLIS